MSLIFGSIQQGFIYAILALGVYVTFRILNLPDMTVDGSFTLGMATAAFFANATNPIYAILLAVVFGALAGLVTGLLQTKVKIHPILSGILVMTGLYSINMAIMGGKGNVSLNATPTYFKSLSDLMNNALVGKTICAFIVCLIPVIGLSIFFKTRIGLAVRATGDNEDMVRSSSINANRMKCVALAIGNACVALSGALMAHYNLSYDVNYGTGMVVIGLASVIIGETILGRRSVTFGLFATVFGAIVYRVLIALALNVELFPPYALKLISAVIVAIALSLPTIQESYRTYQIRRRSK